MKTKMVLFYLLAALLGGCVPVFSLHPLYTEKDVVIKQELAGVWADPNDPEVTWDFRRDAETKNAYKLIVILDPNEGGMGLFDAHLLKLKDQLYLDIFPAQEGFEQTLEILGEAAKDPNNKVWAVNIVIFTVPVHTFIKVDLDESTLTMRLTDDDLLEELLEQAPKAVKHAVLDDDRVILTASTKELQAFVLKYAEGDKLFEEPTVFKRKKADKPKNAESAGK